MSTATIFGSRPSPAAQPAAVLAMPVASVLETMPSLVQPHQRIAGQGWGRVIEDAYQNRFHQARHQHA